MANEGVLKSGDCLQPTNPGIWPINQGTVSPNGNFQLQYQNDGNLVLYQTPVGMKEGDSRKVMQTARTNIDLGKWHDSYAEMKPNGKLTIVHVSDHGQIEDQWATQAHGPEGCNLYLDNSGGMYYAMSSDDPKKVTVTL